MPGTTTLAPFDPRRLVPWLWAATALVIALGTGREIAAALSGVATRKFGAVVIGFDYEANLPAWYSSSQLLIAAILLFAQYRAARHAGDRQKFGWLILASGFFYLSADETAQLHEAFRFVGPLLHATHAFRFGWVIVAIPAVAVAALVLLPFLVRLPPRTRLGFAVSGAVYVAGTIGLELYGAFASERFGFNSVEFIVGFILEESLEMIGVTLFIASLTAFMARPPLAQGTRL